MVTLIPRLMVLKTGIVVRLFLGDCTRPLLTAVKCDNNGGEIFIGSEILIRFDAVGKIENI